jgi:hypothetical protein
MMLHKALVVLISCVLASLAIFIPKASAHTDIAIIHQVNQRSLVTMQSARNPRTTPKTTNSELPTPDVILTEEVTLQNNTILPEGTVLLNNQQLPAGTKFSNGRVLLTTVTLQGPVKLQDSITVPAGTQLQSGTALPIEEVIPGTQSFD